MAADAVLPHKLCRGVTGWRRSTPRIWHANFGESSSDFDHLCSFEPANITKINVLICAGLFQHTLQALPMKKQNGQITIYSLFFFFFFFWGGGVCVFCLQSLPRVSFIAGYFHSKSDKRKFFLCAAQMPHYLND